MPNIHFTYRKETCGVWELIPPWRHEFRNRPVVVFTSSKCSTLPWYPACGPGVPQVLYGKEHIPIGLPTYAMAHFLPTELLPQPIPTPPTTHSWRGRDEEQVT